MHLLPLLRALSSEAGSGDDDHVSTVGQAIQAGRGEQRIAEQLRPFLRGTIAGEQDAAALVPLVDDVVEVLRGRRSQWLEPEVIQHQQVGTEVGLEASFQSAVGTPPVEVLEHTIGVDEESGVAPSTGFVGQRLGEMGFDEPINMPPLGRKLSAT